MARSTVSLRDLLEHGRRLFTAVWTIQEGGGRPLTKGTGNPLSDPFSDSNPGGERLEFPRISIPRVPELISTCSGATSGTEAALNHREAQKLSMLGELRQLRSS
jgi:hypothetical protein